MHIVAGVVVLFLTISRLVWWQFWDKRPDPAPAPGLQKAVARAVHCLFYVIIFVMAGSGIAMMVMSGAGNILFGSTPPPLPDFLQYVPRIPHGIASRVLMGLLVLHAGAAFYHQFLVKDGLLWRMLPGPPGRLK
jgi:cytochrome b561